MALSIFTLIPSQVYRGDLQKIYDVGYCDKLNAESDKRISCLPLSQTLKSFTKMYNNVILSKNVLIWKI